MPAFDLLVSSRVSQTVRVQQLSAMFDCPISQKLEHHWRVEMPIEDRDWRIGMIVGPSGCGKSQIASKLWPKEMASHPQWGDAAVIDEFDDSLSVKDITDACMSVGFNTIPSWAKPYGVLSNGEQFRVDLARRLLESDGLCVVDEFTSVVDRQVAKVGCHAVQKFVRRQPAGQFVAVTCHYDVIDWLQPDWIYDPSTRQFAWRSLQRRPSVDVTIGPIPYAAWRIFAPFHYMTADLHRAARCFGLWADGRLASIAAMLHRAGNFDAPIIGCSRLVTLPDFQGMGLAMHLIDHVGSIYSAVGKKVHTYPAHPSLIRSFGKSPQWQLRKRAGTFGSSSSKKQALRSHARSWSEKPEGGRHSRMVRRQGGRPCGVFRYIGDACDPVKAQQILAYWEKS